MPHREYLRNGHLVSIDVTRDRRDGWYWSYTIDGAGFTSMLDQRFSSFDIADRDAQQHANEKADALPTGAFGQ